MARFNLNHCPSQTQLGNVLVSNVTLGLAQIESAANLRTREEGQKLEHWLEPWHWHRHWVEPWYLHWLWRWIRNLLGLWQWYWQEFNNWHQSCCHLLLHILISDKVLSIRHWQRHCLIVNARIVRTSQECPIGQKHWLGKGSDWGVSNTRHTEKTLPPNVQ